MIHPRLCIAIVLAAPVAFIGCEKKPTGSPSGPPAAGGSAPAAAPAGGAPAAAPEAAPAAAAAAGATGTASISGTVTVKGEVPPPPALNMSAKPECAQAHADKPALSDSLIVTGGALKDAFVWVKKGISGNYPVPAEPAALDQKGCMYAPHVFAVRVRQDIEIRNSDTWAHNVNVKENNPFNLAQQGGQKDLKKAWFKKEGVPTKFQCDIHSWMSSNACVVSHPFFSLTGADGKFEIKNLPAGKYTIGIWHERVPGLSDPPQKEVEVEVKDGEAKTQDFTYTYSK